MKRDVFTLQLDLGHELIIDNFAGGGTSTGVEAAFGRPVDIAINHDPEALAKHAMNHSHARQLCESVCVDQRDRSKRGTLQSVVLGRNINIVPVPCRPKSMLDKKTDTYSIRTFDICNDRNQRLGYFGAGTTQQRPVDTLTVVKTLQHEPSRSDVICNVRKDRSCMMRQIHQGNQIFRPPKVISIKYSNPPMQGCPRAVRFAQRIKHFMSDKYESLLDVFYSQDKPSCRDQRQILTFAFSLSLSFSRQPKRNDQRPDCSYGSYPGTPVRLIEAPSTPRCNQAPAYGYEQNPENVGVATPLKKSCHLGIIARRCEV